MIKLLLKIFSLFVFIILFFIQSSIPLTHTQKNQSKQMIKIQDPSEAIMLNLEYGKIPMYFISNEGQVDEKVLFYTKASSYTLWITKEGLVFDSLRKIEVENHKQKITNHKERNKPEETKYDRAISRLIFLNSNKETKVIPVDITEQKVNYFIGNDESKWKTNIATSNAILYKELYKNIELKVYGLEKEIEYDFIVKPGGRVSDIRFEYQNVEKTRIDKDGNLVIDTRFGEMLHAKPVCYQLIEGKKIEVEAQFLNFKKSIYGFRVEKYNKAYKLIIDPLILVYSTYLGGKRYDYGRGIAVDKEGAVYVTGQTVSDNFPVKNSVQSNIGGAVDAFVIKINPQGNKLEYSTYLGGRYSDSGHGITVDSSAAVYVTGSANSGFPTKKPIKKYGQNYDAFVTKINSQGNKLIYSTYLGGSYLDCGCDICIDSSNTVYVTGYTQSTDFPTKKAIFKTFSGGNFGGDVFITKINSKGSKFVFSTYLGGSDNDRGHSIAIDSSGETYVTGYTQSTDFPTKKAIFKTFSGGVVNYWDWGDAFITKINSKGNDLVFSTYLGGSDNDLGEGIGVDRKGAVYVTGCTESVDFPTKNSLYGSNAGRSDVFVTKINPRGKRIVYSTYIGGSNSDYGEDIAVNSSGDVYLAGNTISKDFPIKKFFQKKKKRWDCFIMKIASKGKELIYSSLLGGSNDDWVKGIGLDNEGAVYLTGYTWSKDFPTISPIQKKKMRGEDLFISKLEFGKKSKR